MHVLDARQFPREWLEGELFPLIREMREVVRAGGSHTLLNKEMVTLFYGARAINPTRVSFEAAMLRLGGAVLYSVHNSVDVPRGSALQDTVGLVNAYETDVIVLEHPAKGAARRVAKHSVAPIINAGDGVDHGPTEALSKVFTIQENTFLGEDPDPRTFYFQQAQNNLFVRMALLQLMLRKSI